MPHLSRRHAAFGIVLSAAAIAPVGSNTALGQGGVRLRFRVDVEGLRSQRLDTLRDDARRTLLREPPLAVADAIEARDGAVTLRIRDEAQVPLARARLQALAQATAPPQIRETELAEPEPGRFELHLTESGLSERVRVAADRSAEVIRRRLRFGAPAGVSVVREGSDSLVVQAPDGRDLERIKQLVGRTGQLTFRLVDLSAAQAQSGRPPPDSELLPGEEGGMMLVARQPMLSGEDLLDASAGFSPLTNEPIVSFRLSADGTRRLAEVTRDNVGRPLAIVLDDRVMSAPMIREPILGGQGQISGRFTVQTANDLAVLLRSGALPVRLIFVEER